MTIAHLILAHNNPSQLKRLIMRLQHIDADFYIHIDLKTPIEPFLPLTQIPQVYLIAKREKVAWGAYSIIQATINGLEQILASGKTYHYINLLSGQDYPICSTQHIHQFLANNPHKAFVEFYDIATVWTEAIPRLTKYHLTNYQFKGNLWVEKWLNKLLPPRTMPNDLIPVGRSQWFTLTGIHAKYIVDYLQKNKNVQRFFQLTWGCDEIVIQTILYNSNFRADMVNNNLRHIDWSEGNASPKTFKITDATALQNSGKLFARKFSEQVDSKILDYLDAQNT